MLMVEIGAWHFGWFHLKLLFVLGLSGYHGWIAGYAKKLARGERPLSEKQLRLLNEIPGIAAAVIVIARSEEHTSELQSLMRISYAVFCLKKKNTEKDKLHKNC